MFAARMLIVTIGQWPSWSLSRTPGRLPLVNSTPAASRAELWLPYLLGLLLSRLGGLACPNFSATICRTASPRLKNSMLPAPIVESLQHLVRQQDHDTV